MREGPLPFFNPFSSVGQAFGPAAGLPPGAGKRKLLGQRREPCLYRVPFDVALHSRGSFIIRDQVVVTFVLPERRSTQAEHPNGFVPGETFERPKPFSRRYTRSHEQMNVIRHYDKGVKFITFESAFPVGKGAHNHLCDFRLTQKNRAACRVIEQAIHCREGLSGCQSGVRKGAVDRKTSVQSEGHEHSFANDIPMRKAPIISAHIGFSGHRVFIVSGSFVIVCAGRKPGGRAEAPPHLVGGSG
jgi:hypothetical protein